MREYGVEASWTKTFDYCMSKYVLDYFPCVPKRLCWDLGAILVSQYFNAITTVVFCTISGYLEYHYFSTGVNLKPFGYKR